jgi:hypothetical protein
VRPGQFSGATAGAELKPPGDRRELEALGAIVGERPDRKPGGLGELAAPGVYLGRLDFAVKEKRAVAPEAIGRMDALRPTAAIISLELHRETLRWCLRWQ